MCREETKRFRKSIRTRILTVWPFSSCFSTERVQSFSLATRINHQCRCSIDFPFNHELFLFDEKKYFEKKKPWSFRDENIDRICSAQIPRDTFYSLKAAATYLSDKVSSEKKWKRNKLLLEMIVIFYWLKWAKQSIRTGVPLVVSQCWRNSEFICMLRRTRQEITDHLCR